MVQQVYAFFALLIPSLNVSLRAKRGIEEGISEAKKGNYVPLKQYK